MYLAHHELESDVVIIVIERRRLSVLSFLLFSDVRLTS